MILYSEFGTFLVFETKDWILALIVIKLIKKIISNHNQINK